MEEISLREIGAELRLMKKILLNIQENLAEDELEISDEVMEEVASARESKNYSNEDIVREFL